VSGTRGLVTVIVHSTDSRRYPIAVVISLHTPRVGMARNGGDWTLPEHLVEDVGNNDLEKKDIG